MNEQKEQMSAAPHTDSAPAYVQALAHPLRMRILAALRTQAMTASELARTLGIERRQATYHARKMLNLGFLSAAPGPNGSAEQRYQLVALPHWSDDAWDLVPTTAKHAYVTALVNQFHATALASVPYGGFDRANMHLTRTRVLVDDETWDELSTELASMLDRIDALHAEGARRVAEEGAAPVHATAAMMLFTTPVNPPDHDVPEPDLDPTFTEDEAHNRALDIHEALGHALATGRDWAHTVNLVDELRVVLAAADALPDSQRSGGAVASTDSPG